MPTINLKHVNKSIIALALAATPLTGILAQSSGQIGDEQINVVKAYRPVLSDAVKISDAPRNDTVSVAPPELKYHMQESAPQTGYNITPIKPVRIKDENIKKLYRGFVKAGYGNYNTPYGELFFNALRSRDFDAGIHLRHLSSNGKIKGYGFPGYSENDLAAFVNKFLDHSVISGRLSYDRDVVHYYGYTLEHFSKKETRHRMGTVDGEFSIASTHNDKYKFDYKAAIAFYSFTDNLEQSESDFSLGGMVGKHLANNHYVKAGFELNPSRSQWPGNYCPPGVICTQVAAVSEVKLNRTVIRMSPRYEFTKNNIRISAGGNIAVESAYDETKWHLFPVAEIRYPLIKDELFAFGELSGDLQKNTLRSINDENPFTIPMPVNDFTVLANTSNKINVKGGFEVRPDHGLMVVAWAGVSRFKGDVFFVNSLNTTGITTYTPSYLDHTRLNIHVEGRYELLKKIGLWVKTDYYSYNMSDGQQPWFRPSVMLTVGGHYHIAEKIYASTEVYISGARTAATIDGEGRDLKGYVDANIGIDYRYSKVLSVFVKVHNLTASRYFEWYRYPSYKINAMAGLSYSF